MIFGIQFSGCSVIPFYEQQADGNFIRRNLYIYDSGDFELQGSKEIGRSKANPSMPKYAKDFYPTGFIVNHYNGDRLCLYIVSSDNIAVTSKEKGSLNDKLEDIVDKIKNIEKAAIPIKYNGDGIFYDLRPATDSIDSFSITQRIYEEALKTSLLREEIDPSANSTLFFNNKPILIIDKQNLYGLDLIPTYKSLKILDFVHDDEVICSIRHNKFSERLLIGASIVDDNVILDVIGPVSYKTGLRLERMLGWRRIIGFELKDINSTFVKAINGSLTDEKSHLDEAGTFEDFEHIVRAAVKEKFSIVGTELPKEIEDMRAEVKKNETAADELGLISSLIPAFEKESKFKEMIKYLSTHAIEER